MDSIKQTTYLPTSVSTYLGKYLLKQVVIPPTTTALRLVNLDKPSSLGALREP